MIRWVFYALSAGLTFAIAAAAVGSVSHSLAVRPRRAVYDVDAAVQEVGDALPAEMSARLSYDDVRTVLEWRIEIETEAGVASTATAAGIGEELVLITDDEELARLLGRVAERDLELDDADVARIVAADDAYRTRIGVIGPEVS